MVKQQKVNREVEVKCSILGPSSYKSNKNPPVQSKLGESGPHEMNELVMDSTHTAFLISRSNTFRKGVPRLVGDARVARG